MGDHLRPKRGVIVRTIDAHGVGAVGNEVGDDFWIVRRVGAQGYQDAAGLARPGGAEDLGAIAGEQPLAAEELPQRRPANARRRGGAGEARQRHDERVERGEHAALRAPERGKAERHQVALQRAQIVLAECEVMAEVERAEPKPGTFDAWPPLAECDLALFGDLAAQAQDVPEEATRVDLGTATGHKETISAILSIPPVHDISVSAGQRPGGTKRRACP